MSSATSGLPVDYRALVDELHRLASIHRQPVNGTFELTERCNLGCRMCYVCRSPGDEAQRRRELTAAGWFDLARQAADNGTVFLLLTGGEVFLRQDFFDIYTPLTRMGFTLTLYTNATLVTDGVAARLAEAPPGRTEVTLYGATAATYEAVTGVPGSYARCCAGIEALRRHRVQLGLKTTITRQNVAELDRMRQMAQDWGVPFSAGWLLSGRRDGAPSDVADCRLPACDCVALEATDRASASEWLEAAIRAAPRDPDRTFYCQAGQSAYVINAAGEMNACIDVPAPSAHPLEVGFGNAWAQVQRYVDSAPPLGSACSACDARSFCPSCPAWSQLETGSLTAPVPYLCDIAWSRKARYGDTA
jgi:radical SAM protein with 4Fe4S-binding SPASM domain